MRCVIAGSRDLHYMYLLEEAIAESGFEITEGVCGLARGLDTLGKQWAERNGIPVKEFPALWDKHGKRAGYIRNKEMAEYCDCCIIVCYEDSRGSHNMEQCMLECGKPYYMVILSRE